MGSSLKQGPVWDPFYKGAELNWGQKRDPNLANYAHEHSQSSGASVHSQLR